MQGLFWNPFERQIPKLSLESQFEQNLKEKHSCCKVFQHYCNWYECMCAVFVCIHVTSCRTNVPGLSTVAQWESAIGLGGHKNEHFSNYFTFLEKPCFININQQTFILLRIRHSTLNIGSTNGRPNSHCALVTMEDKGRQYCKLCEINQFQVTWSNGLNVQIQVLQYVSSLVVDRSQNKLV